MTPSIGVRRHLISGVLCLTVISLICSSASAQNLFVSVRDAGGGKIFEFTPNGMQSTFASGLSNPAGLAFDSAGNLFVGDGDAIYKFTRQGVRTTFALGLSSPYPIGCDSAGNLFVADSSGSILKFTPNGVRTTFASGVSGFEAVDSAGNLFVAKTVDNAPPGQPVTATSFIIYKFSPNGVRSTFASGRLATSLGGVSGLGVDHSGNLYLVDGGRFYDGGGSAIYKFTPGGNRSTFFGPTPVWGCFFGSLAVDSMGNVFVTDDCTGIDKITPSGVQTTFASGVSGPLAFGPPTRAGRSDFNGDGHPDYVLYNRFTRQTAIWYLNNNVFTGGRYGPTIPAGWSVVDMADFDGDGHPDYALQNANTHQTAIWYLNNNVFIHGAYGPTLPSGWLLGAVADFNGDGKPDYLLYTNVGSNFPTAIWYMNNNVHVASASGPTLPDGWFLRGVADFNGDGKPDLLLYHPSYVLGADNNNRTAIWYLNNNVFLTGRFGPTIPDGWSVAGVADFNRDGHPDYVLNNFNTLRTAIWYLNNDVFTRGAFGPTLPLASTSSLVSWDLVAPSAGGTAPSDCAGCWDYP